MASSLKEHFPSDGLEDVAQLRQELQRLTEQNTRLSGELQEINLKAQLYHQAVNNSPNPIYSIDGHGIIQTWNPACSKIFFYDESIIGQHYQKLLFNPEQRDFVAQQLSEVSRGRVLSNIDLSYRCKNGAIREMVSRIYALQDSQNQTSGFVFANTDVTERNRIHRELEGYRNHLEQIVSERTAKLKLEINERREAQTALKASNDVLITILDSIEVEIGVIDLQNSEIIFANRQLKDKYGYGSRDAVSGFPEFQQEEEFSASDCCRLWGEDNQPSSGISRVIFNSSRERWYLQHRQIIQWIDGNMVLLSVATDITERKRIDEELQRVERLESIGILAGGIAHDFNNLLTGILGNISLLRCQTSASHHSHPLLENVEKAASRATILTHQLLTFSKGGEPIRKSVSVADLLLDSLDFVTRGSKLSYFTDFEPTLRAADIDEGQITQVFHNLVLNAVQAMVGGGVLRVSAKNSRVGAASAYPLAPGEYLSITFEDDGPGITPEDLPRIFDPYFTTKEKGNGLGLATSYNIIKKHGGYIAVISEGGKGTRFTVLLPATDQPPVSNVVQQWESSSPGQGYILLMDDEEIIRDVASALLNQIGCEVVTAKDGEEALSLYCKKQEEGRPFDAVILDLTIIGGMGGKQAIKELQKVDPEVRAVVSSGYSDDPVMANFKSFGFIDVMTKPYHIEEVAAVIKRVVSFNSLPQ